jgi:hypothetical protein
MGALAVQQQPGTPELKIGKQAMRLHIQPSLKLWGRLDDDDVHRWSIDVAATWHI